MSPERAWNTFGRAHAALTNRARIRPGRPCPCRCGKLDGICDEHLARLAQIAQALVADGKRKGPRKGRRIAGTRGIEIDLEDE